MSEMAGGMESTNATESSADAVAAGAMLRQAREAAGLHIAALAVSLKVPVSKLEALERGDVAALPDIVFVRALASSVCRSLKVDAAPVLALLPQVQGARLAADSAGINTPVKGSAPKPALAGASTSPSRAMKWMVAALVCGTLVLLFLPQLRSLLESVQPMVTADSAVGEKPTGAATAPAADVMATEPIATASMPMVSLAPAPEASVPAAAAPTAAQPVAAASSADVGSDLLLLRSSGPSWVQVRDARGTVLLQRNLAAGESVPVTGALPLAVVVGRIDVTEVFVRGQSFNLSSVARDNVARFEVK